MEKVRENRLFSLCKKMEAEFVYMMVKSLRKMAPAPKTHYSFFFDMLDRHYAELLSKRYELGLAHALYQSLSRYEEVQ
jgi:Rod binding domain-containing protein